MRKADEVDPDVNADRTDTATARAGDADRDGVRDDREVTRDRDGDGMRDDHQADRDRDGDGMRNDRQADRDRDGVRDDRDADRNGPVDPTGRPV